MVKRLLPLIALWVWIGLLTVFAAALLAGQRAAIDSKNSLNGLDYARNSQPPAASPSPSVSPTPSQSPSPSATATPTPTMPKMPPSPTPPTALQ